MNNLGNFQLGTTTTLLGGDSAAGGLPDTLSGSPTQSTTNTTTTGEATPIQATASTVDSDSTSEGISGNPVTITADSFVAKTFTSTSAGLVVTLTPSGTVGEGINTTVDAFALPGQMTPSGAVSDPFTTATAKRELSLGDFTLGEQVLGEEEFLKTSMSLNTIGDSLVESFGGDTTDMSTQTFLADSLSEGISGDTTLLDTDVFLATGFSVVNADVDTEPLDLTPLQGDRLLTDWAIDPGPKIIETSTEEVRVFDSFEITWVSSIDTLRDIIRPNLQNASKVDVVPDIDGGFNAVDRAGGSNTVNLYEPDTREDLRTVDTWLIDEYEEKPLDTEAKRWEVTVTFVPEIEKSYDNKYGSISSPGVPTRESGEWLYEFENGGITTKNVTTSLEKVPNKTFDKITLNMVLTPEQLRIVEENLGRLKAQYVRDVPDGDNVLVDQTSSGRNTVTVTPPSGATDTVESGDYVVSNWETTYNQTIYRIEMEVVKT